MFDVIASEGDITVLIEILAFVLNIFYTVTVFMLWHKAYRK